MKILCLIPARSGSKGIPQKNKKILKGKPLILYTIELAKTLFEINDICISTDDDDIIKIAEKSGLLVKFKRSALLSNDTAGMRDVIIDAINFNEGNGCNYDVVLLLQPTSPIRSRKDIIEMIKLYNSSLDMVVSVGKSHNNPYFNIFEENEFGLLEKSKNNNFQNRQSAPEVYFYNGSAYLININSLKSNLISDFKKIRKFVMSDINSIDIDTKLDWLICETILNNNLTFDDEL